MRSVRLSISFSDTAIPERIYWCRSEAEARATVAWWALNVASPVQVEIRAPIKPEKVTKERKVNALERILE